MTMLSLICIYANTIGAIALMQQALFQIVFYYKKECYLMLKSRGQSVIHTKSLLKQQVLPKMLKITTCSTLKTGNNNNCILPAHDIITI